MASRKIQVVVAGDAKSLERALGRAGAATAGFGKRVGVLSRLGSALKFGALSAGIVGFGAAITKVAGTTVNFDKAMRNVNSIAQLPEGSLKGLEKQVLALAGKTAQAPQTLAEGLYDLVSSGFDAKDSMTILKSSAKAATAGLTDTATSTKAVAAVLNAYHLPASKAALVSDELFQTVNRGVISFETLAQTVGDVLPFAASLHVGLGQVGASISTMTKQGLSGEEATTRLKNVMVAFLKPSKDLAKSIKATGASSAEALIHQKGFQGALEAVIGTTDGTKASIAKLFPNIRALGGALSLTGTNAKTAHGDLKAFGDVTGATDKALKQQSKSIAFQWNRIKAVIASLAIQLGSILIPAVSKAMQWIGKFISEMKRGVGVPGQIRDAAVKAFTAVKSAVKSAVAGIKDLVKGFQQGKGWAVALVAAMAGFATFAAILKGVAIATRLWAAAQVALDIAMAANPVVLAIAAIVALGVAIYIAYKKSETFRNVINGAFNAVKGVVLSATAAVVTAVRGMIQWVSTAFHNAVAEVSSWKVLWAAVGLAVRVASAYVKTQITILVAAVRVGLAIIGPQVRTAMAVIRAAFSAGWAAVKAIFQNAWAAIRGIVSGGAQIIKGVVQVITGIMRGDFGRMWAGIKSIFSGGVKVLGGVLRTMFAPGIAAVGAFKGVVSAAWHGILAVIKGVVGAILGAFQLFLSGLAKIIGAAAKLPIIGGKFKGLAKEVQAAADKVGALRSQIDSLHDKTVHVNVQTGGSGETFGKKGHKQARGASVDGPSGQPYFETEVSIANAQAAQEALQERFQKADDARQEKSLKNALARAVKSKKGVDAAKNALHSFQRQLSQTAAVSTLDVKIKGLQAVKAFKDALASVRGQLHDLASQAAGVFRSRREAAIASGPEAKELASLQGTDKAEQDRQTRDQLNQDLADAVASGDVAAQRKANDAIAADNRRLREEQLQASIDSQISGLDTEEANYQTSLDNRLGALADNLQNGKIKYATFASEVNAILQSVGLNYNANPDEEISIDAHPAGAPKAKPKKKPKKKKAFGGPVRAGVAYQVGEFGRETFVPDTNGQIVPNGRGMGGGGNVHVHGDLVVKRTSDADRFARRLARQLAY